MKSQSAQHSRFTPSLKRVIQHLRSFMDQNSLWAPSHRYALAVSGGVDSIFGFHLFCHLKDMNLVDDFVVLHVNHGTRAECDREEEFVKELCLKNKVSFQSTRLLLFKQQSNFEKKARQERYDFFSKHVGPNDRLVLFHHIDDSFEWSLMSQFKSSEIHSSIGIPVVNGNIIRPLMSYTREQIVDLAQRFDLKWSEDSSNLDLSFERNYVRQVIVPKIKERFPSYLKHYVHRAERMATEQKLLRAGGSHHFLVEDLPFGVVAISHKEGANDFKGAFDLISREIKKLGDKKRGVLSSQIEKLIKMVGGQKMGPLTFSGGVYGFTSTGVIFLMTQKSMELYRQYDQDLAEIIQKTSQIPFVSLNMDSQRKTRPAPQYLFYKLSKKAPDSLKGIHPLIPKSCQTARDLGIGFRPLNYFLGHKKPSKDFLILE